MFRMAFPGMVFSKSFTAERAEIAEKIFKNSAFSRVLRGKMVLRYYLHTISSFLESAKL